jgi:hypothetical protein
MYLSILCGSQCKTAIISLNSINQLVFVMVKCSVHFEERT